MAMEAGERVWGAGLDRKGWKGEEGGVLGEGAHYEGLLFVL